MEPAVVVEPGEAVEAVEKEEEPSTAVTGATRAGPVEKAARVKLAELVDWAVVAEPGEVLLRSSPSAALTLANQNSWPGARMDTSV